MSSSDNSMSSYDVVIVGAGPSGSSAAYFLAKDGLKVLLIDKASFPREKTCGDGLGPRTLVMLDKMGLLDWVATKGAYRCNKARLFSTKNDYFEARIPAQDSPHPYFYILNRKDLDQKLLETAISAGADFISECKAMKIIWTNSDIKKIKALKGGKAENKEINIACKIVVCADGTHGTFAPQTDIKSIQPGGFAIRAYYSNIKGLDDCINVLIDNKIPEGYAWVFPTSDTSANVGLGISARMLKKHKINPKDLLSWFIKERDINPVYLKDAKQESEIKGAYLRMGYGWHQVVSDGIIFVGDAAALINPLSGEGIAYALESGELAASAIKFAFRANDFSKQTLKVYQEQLNNLFFKEHRICTFFRQSLSFLNYSVMDKLIVKGARNPELADKFLSVMMSTAKLQSLINPKYLRHLI